jgi:hypothetical protein
MSDSYEEDEYHQLRRLDTNLHALEHREEEEMQEGVHILGGEIFNSIDAISSNEEVYPDFSTIDKSSSHKVVNDGQVNLLLKGSQSRSKLVTSKYKSLSLN